MRAILTNFGTAGDVEPFVALAVELRRHGHQPVLALSPYYAPRAAELGLEFFAVGPDLRESQNEINRLMASTPEVSVSAEHMRDLGAPMAAAMPQMFDDLRMACRGADVLIAGALQVVGRMVHDITGIPFVSVFLVYLTMRARPNAAFFVSLPIVNGFRARLGLPPIKEVPDNSLPAPDAVSPLLNLYALSPTIIARPPDWPAHYHLTGYLFLDAEGWRPDPVLEEFLAAGESPVVLSFGSVTHDDPGALTALVLEAVRLAGCRAIIQQGWSGLARQQLPAGVHAAGFVPHSWLFPRAACVVHHGGVGTTAATFRAGVPAVLVPHAYDQPFNAEVARELGVAGPAIYYSQLSAARLAAAIRRTLDTPAYHQAAAALGARIRAEQGVRKARLLIEQLVESLGAQPDGDPEASRERIETDERRARMLRRAHYLQQRQR